MMNYICLRDDDTSFFTNIEELQSAFGPIWGKHPLTLATIPFVHGSEIKIKDFDMAKDKFKQLREWEKSASKDELDVYHSVHPIGQNKELVSGIKELVNDNKIEIALHGYNHKYNIRGAEMFSDSVSYYDLEEGKEYLEKCFDTVIKTFIPPSNTIDLKCSIHVKNLGMNLFSSGTPKGRTKVEKFMALARDLSPLVEKINSRKRKMPIKTRNGMPVFSSYTFGANIDTENFLETIRECLRMFGFAAIGTHYWFLNNNPSMKQMYYEMIKNLEADDVVFLTASEYFNKIKRIL